MGDAGEVDALVLGGAIVSGCGMATCPATSPWSLSVARFRSSTFWTPSRRQRCDGWGSSVRKRCVGRYATPTGTSSSPPEGVVEVGGDAEDRYVVFLSVVL